MDSWPSDWIMPALALTCFYNESVRFILLPYPGLEPHQPVKDYSHRQPAILQLPVSSCPPFHAVDLHLVSFPIFSYCDFSVPFHSPCVSDFSVPFHSPCMSDKQTESRRSEVQTGFLLSAYNFALTVTSSRLMPFHSEKYLLLIHNLAQVEPPLSIYLNRQELLWLLSP